MLTEREIVRAKRASASARRAATRRSLISISEIAYTIANELSGNRSARVTSDRGKKRKTIKLTSSNLANFSRPFSNFERINLSSLFGSSLLPGLGPLFFLGPGFPGTVPGGGADSGKLNKKALYPAELEFKVAQLEEGGGTELVDFAGIEEKA